MLKRRATVDWECLVDGILGNWESAQMGQVLINGITGNWLPHPAIASLEIFPSFPANFLRVAPKWFQPLGTPA
jgi:hypothetical protein